MAANEKSKELQTFADDLTRASETLVAEVDKLLKSDENHDQLLHFVDGAMLTSISFQQKLEILKVDLGKEQESSCNRHSVEKPVSSNDKNISEQLKAQLSRNLEIQNAKLQTEIELRDKITDMKSLSQLNQQLNEDWISSHRNSLKLLKLLEQKYAIAEKKILTLQKELSKSQEAAKKYKVLYETNLKAPTPLPSERAALDLDELRPKTASKAMLSSFRVNDVVRRNECLTQENGDLTREVQRLKRDNSDLLKKAKRSMSDRESILVRLQTSESSKQELYKRLNKEKQRHQSLNRSLTKKASDWIQTKKLIHQLEEDYKWEQISPISPFGVDHMYNIGPICNGPSYLPRGIASAELYE